MMQTFVHLSLAFHVSALTPPILDHAYNCIQAIAYHADSVPYIIYNIHMTIKNIDNLIFSE